MSENLYLTMYIEYTIISLNMRKHFARIISFLSNDEGYQFDFSVPK